MQPQRADRPADVERFEALLSGKKTTAGPQTVNEETRPLQPEKKPEDTEQTRILNPETPRRPESPAQPAPAPRNNLRSWIIFAAVFIVVVAVYIAKPTASPSPAQEPTAADTASVLQDYYIEPVDKPKGHLDEQILTDSVAAYDDYEPVDSMAVWY